MKTRYLFFLLFTFSVTFGQHLNSEKISKLENEVKRIEREIKFKQDTLNELKNEIKFKQDTLNELKNEIKKVINIEYISKINNDNLLIKAKLNSNGKLRKSDNPLSEIIVIFDKNEIVNLTDYKDGYWTANKNQYFGYLNEIYIEENDEIKKIKEVLNLKKIEYQKKIDSEKIEYQKKIDSEKQEKLRIIEEQEKLLQKEEELTQIQKQKEFEEKLTKQFGKVTAKKLIDGYYWIGMTDKMALISLGAPRNINRTVGSWGIHEQWIYLSLYLYFENGILKSYQNSK